MYWTRDSGRHRYWAPDSMKGLPAYKRDAYDMFTRGQSYRLIVGTAQEYAEG